MNIKGKTPTKTYINLLPEDKVKKKNVTAIVVFLVFMVLLAICTKIFVIDKLRELDKAESNYRSVQNEVNELIEYNSDYDEVLEEYHHYGVAYLSDEEIVIQSREKLLNLIDDTVASKSSITSIEIEDNICRLELESVTLSEVAEIVGDLEDSDIVQYVLVETAGSSVYETSENVDAEIKITFNDAVEIEDNTAALEAELEELVEEGAATSIDTDSDLAELTGEG